MKQIIRCTECGFEFTYNIIDNTCDVAIPFTFFGDCPVCDGCMKKYPWR